MEALLPPTAQEYHVSLWERMFKCYWNISVSFQSWAFSFGGIICNPINFIQQPSWKKFQLNASWSCGCCQCCYHLRHSHPLLKGDLSSEFIQLTCPWEPRGNQAAVMTWASVRRTSCGTSLWCPADEGDLGGEHACVINGSGPPDINTASLSRLWTPDPVFREPLPALPRGVWNSQQLWPGSTIEFYSLSLYVCLDFPSWYWPHLTPRNKLNTSDKRQLPNTPNPTLGCQLRM